jgi:hypothetical protein
VEALEETQRGELIEIVTESRHEVAKERPNKRRLQALLASTSEIVSTFADLKPAYELVKSGLESIGIKLP